MHHEPVFDRLQQPDQHRGEEDHQHVKRGTQRCQPIQELVHDPGRLLANAFWQDPVDEPLPDLL